MRTSIIGLVIACLIHTPALAAQPDGETRHPGRLIISDRAVAGGLTVKQPPAREHRDSILNGTLIGAAIGGAVMGGFVTFLCNALQEPSDPSCLGSALMATGIGAGAGAAAGAGIDAMLTKQSRRILVRIPLTK